MKKLNEKEWKPIPMKRLFTKFVRGKVSSASDEPKCENGVPYVGATDRNNGVIDYLKADKAKTQPGNCVTFIRDGQGSVGSSVYRATPCIATVNTSSGYAKWLNQDTGLFVSTSSNQVREKYSFGYKRKETRLLAERVMLPVDDDGNPDYSYMAQYTSDIRRGMLTRYRNYVAGQLSQLEYEDIPALDEKEWEHFLIPDIFSKIQRGKRLKNADHIPGEIPYVSSTANNNGVDDYIVASHGTRVFKDCISLANSGSVGTAFYEPFQFVASDHVTSLKIENGSKFVYLFLVSAIEKQGSNFNFNREINDLRIKKMQVMLPVDDDGKPDYAYMEQYAKNMMLKKYEQYLTFLQQGSNEQ